MDPMDRSSILTRHAAGCLLVVALGGTAAACSAGHPAAADTLRAGIAAQRAGDLGAAEDLYGQVVADEPRNAIALYDLGTVQLARGELGDAERSFRAALDARPSFPQALYDLAIVRSRVGATQEAIDLYRRVLAANPNDAAAHKNLGLLLQASGRTGAATKQLAIAQALLQAGT
jgi:tetratricopeptide (TPR) repeat protein